MKIPVKERAMYTRYNVKLTDPNVSWSKFLENKGMVLWWLFHRLTRISRALPDYLIIGVQKGGTTSLYRYLSHHPNVLPPFRKEIKYFDFNHPWGLNWYQANFPLRRRLVSRHAITGEASPNYIFHPNGPARIAQALPGIKLIVLLRNPVDRAYSQYHHMYREKREELSFNDATAQEAERLSGEADRIAADPNYSQENYLTHSYLARGKYAEQISRLFDLFPRRNILILKSEDLFTAPSQVYHQTLAFLGLPEVDLPVYTVDNEGNYPAMDSGTRQKLTEYFKPYNEELYRLLDRDFGWE
jgi:hypothetical protein